MAKSADDRAFYGSLAQLTEGSIEGLFARASRDSVKEAPESREARAGDRSWVLPFVRVALVVFFGIPWVIGLLALGWWL